MRTILLSTLFLAWMAVGAGAADKAAPGAPTSAGATAARTANQQVIAYYFHGEVRCETCLKIERQAREIIEKRFAKEMAVKRLVFKPVNYEKPANAHFLKDYQLPCPSLVVVRQKAGKDEKWKLLGETWEHIQIPEKFKSYVEGEVEKILPPVK